MDLNVFLVIIGLVVCALVNSYCCAFIHVERYITLHEPLLVVPAYSWLIKMGLGIPGLLFWAAPTIIVFFITENVFASIAYFVLAQLLAPTSLIMVHRFRKRIVGLHIEPSKSWQENRNDFYEWMIKHPALIMDYSRIPFDPFLVYMELRYPDDLNQEITI